MNFANPFPSARRAFALGLALFWSVLVFPLLAEDPNPGGPHKVDSRITALLSKLSSVRHFHQTALAPDDRQIAWVVDSPDGGTMIELASTAAPDRVSQVTAAKVTSADKRGACREGEIVWRPDGKQLAFLSNCNSINQMQIFVVATSALQSPRQLGQIEGIAQALEWAPDGHSLGFLYVKGATRRSGALDAMKAPSGVIGEEGLEVQRVAAVGAEDGKLQVLTPASLHVFEFDWSPDSQQLAYVAAAPPGENNWWIAQLYTQSIHSAQPQSIFDPNKPDSPLHGLQIAVPRWSPDGKHLAFIGGLMSDQGVTGGDIYTLGATGGKPHLISPDASHDVSVSWINWRQPDSIGFSYISRGLSGYGNVQPSNNAASTEIHFLVPALIGDGRLEGSLSFARSGRVAFIRSSFSEAPEIWAGNFSGEGSSDGPHPITHYNDALKPTWGKAESITWSSDAATGKFDVQGWLLYPASYDPARKYSMIVSVHGGPASAELPRWPGLGFDATAFSALDYFVFFPNPRGSYGQGEAFTMANRKDFGYGDLHDILTGVDAVVAKYPIESTRVGLTGWSYGGFMTMFAVTQTQRFRAAVAGAGISNWQSYYGENSIDQWMIPYFGASVYQDPAVYSKSSAINFIGQAKTPTLVVVGDRDGECPAPQSFEFWHALRAQQVPTRLVVYPNEGHRFVSAEHRGDVLQRALEWFGEYMPARP